MIAIPAAKTTHVLVVDDDRSMRQLVRHVLKMQPDIFVVAEAADGREAITTALAHDPEVIIMDLEMPELGGLEATQQILAARPDTRVIVFSCRTAQEDFERAFSCGATGYVGKHAAAELPSAIRTVREGRLFFSV